jgi:beta-mannanase
MAGTGMLAAAPVAASASAAGSEQVRIFASDDAFTSSVRRTTAFGAADNLVVGRSGADTRVGFVKFTAPAPAAGARLAGAELRLPTEGHTAGGTLKLARVADTRWSQTTLTAANAPTPGAVAATTPARPTDTVVKFDLAKVVTKPGVYAFALTSTATDVTRLRASEYGAASGGPELRLTLTKTPTPAPATPAPAKCTVDARLVPSCGVLWGGAAGGFTDTPRDEALKAWEQASGRTATIFHQYHKGDEMFPTKAEIAMTRDPAKPRLLLLNWKIAYGTTWAKVAAGEKNARIDKWAAYVKANYNEKFFLALHHEPENDVDPTPGSGMTAKDFAAMYRHIIQRLRGHGLTNVVNVLAYMGNERWMAQSWWKDLYPGDDVVDWIGLDSYVSAEKGYYHYGMFADLLDRKAKGSTIGWYEWATTQHRTKPIMVAEWGVYHRTSVTVDKSAQYASVLPELTKRPAIKAIVHFDTERDDEGDRNISIASTPQSLAAFQKLAANPIFNVNLR